MWASPLRPQYIWAPMASLFKSFFMLLVLISLAVEKTAWGAGGGKIMYFRNERRTRENREKKEK